MKAIRVSQFGSSSELSLENVPLPPPPGPQECRIKVMACGVNPVDTYIREGAYGKLPSLPYIPGKDAAGIVTDVGSDVKEFKLGDRVYVYNCKSGSYAQHSLCIAANIFHLPQEIPFSQGACLGTPAFTAYRALFEKAKARPGDIVFVHGASGGVGLMTVQLAVAAGMRVVGTASTSEGREAVMSSGAEAVYDHRQAGYLDDIASEYHAGFDICVEMLANKNLGRDLPIMAFGGKVCIVGSRGVVEINPRHMMTKELEMYGVALLQSNMTDLKQASAFIDTCLKQGNLRPMVSLALPLSNAAMAHDEIINRQKVTVGNIVLLPND